MTTATKERTTVLLPVASITVSRWNPRKIDPKDPATEALAQSMAAPAGLIQPIAVRPYDTTKFPEHVRERGEQMYELLAGSRRLAAAKLLGWETIAAEVFDVDDATAVSIIVVENLQRKELTPLEEAAGLKVLLERGEDHATIAQHIGWPLSRVARRAQLLKLIPEWHAEVKRQHLEWTAAHLELIARLPEEVQRRLLGEKKLAYYTRTTEELEDAIEKSLQLLKSATFDINNPVLIPAAGACVTCPKRASVQPELFWSEADMPKSLQDADRCLDVDCYQKKESMHLQAVITVAREKNPDIVLISTRDWQGLDGPKPPKGTLFGHEYQKAKKEDRGAMQGLVVHGGKIGAKMWIKVKKEKTAPGTASSRDEKRQQTVELERQRRRKVNGLLEEKLKDIDPECYIAEQPLEVAVARVITAAYVLADWWEGGQLLSTLALLSPSGLLRRMWEDSVVNAGHLRMPDQWEKTWDDETRALCRFFFGSESALFDELWAAAVAKFPDPEPKKVQVKGAKKGKAAPEKKEPRGRGWGAALKRKEQPVASDPLANEHGVYLEETAGDRLEILRIPRPVKRVTLLEIDVVQGSDGRWRAGYHYQGGSSGSSAPAAVGRESFETRGEAIDFGLGRLRSACEGHAKTSGEKADADAAKKAAQAVADFQKRVHQAAFEPQPAPTQQRS